MPTTLNDITSTDWSLSLEGQGQVVQGVDDINQCIWIILYTVPGTDPLRPTFGSNVHQYLDDPITNRAKLIKAIYDAIELWEPRIEVTDILTEINEAQLTVTIGYRIVNTVNTGQLDITYALTI